MKITNTVLGAMLLTCAACDGQNSATNHHRPAAEGSKSALADQPTRQPFPAATQVRLFVETGVNKRSQPTFSDPRGHLLTPAQRSDFEALLRLHRINPNDAVASCFIPHHFFRYFDGTGKQLGEIQVCFCCAGVEVSGHSAISLKSDQTVTADFAKLKAFVSALGERTDIRCDGD